MWFQPWSWAMTFQPGTIINCNYSNRALWSPLLLQKKPEFDSRLRKFTCTASFELTENSNGGISSSLPMHLSHPYPLPLLSPCTFLPFPCRCWRCTLSIGRNMARPTALVRQPEQKDTSVRDNSWSQSQRRLHILLQICMRIHAKIDARFQWVTCNGTMI